MKAFKLTALGFALALALPAHAAVLTTAAWDFDYSSDEAWCTITNVGTKAVENVLIEAVGYDGVVVQSELATLLQPGAGQSMNITLPGDGAYCRFTVPGSAKKFRGVAGYMKSGTIQSLLPAY